MIKRVKKTKNAKALNKLSNGSHCLSLGDGKRSFLFPSLLNNTQSLMNEDDNASVFGELYQTIRSQIADRTAVGTHFVSSDESDGESAGEQSPYKQTTASVSTVPSTSYHIPADYDMTTFDEQNQHDQIALISGSILDDDFASIPSPPNKGHASEEYDFPLPWSPHASSQNCDTLDRSEDEAFWSWSQEFIHDM